MYPFHYQRRKVVYGKYEGACQILKHKVAPSKNPSRNLSTYTLVSLSSSFSHVDPGLVHDCSL